MSFLRHRSRRFYLWGAGALAVAVVIVVVSVVSIRATQDAQEHDPYGAAATEARWNIDPILTTALDDVASQLSLGASLGTAVQDTCRAANPTSMDFSVICERRIFRSYPIATGAGARSLAKRLGPPWQPNESFCDADLTPDSACLQADRISVELMTQPATKNSQGMGLLQSLLLAPKVTSTSVEFTGFDTLEDANAVVIEASSTYYVG
jgi:hypothetical protein